MGSLQCEVKVLRGKKPILFTWENPEKQLVESILVTCPCQKLNLECKSVNQDDDGPFPAEDEAWAARLLSSMENAEVVSLASFDKFRTVFSTGGSSNRSPRETDSHQSKEDSPSPGRKKRKNQKAQKNEKVKVFIAGTSSEYEKDATATDSSAETLASLKPDEGTPASGEAMPSIEPLECSGNEGAAQEQTDGDGECGSVGVAKECTRDIHSGRSAVYSSLKGIPDDTVPDLESEDGVAPPSSEADDGEAVAKVKVVVNDSYQQKLQSKALLSTSLEYPSADLDVQKSLPLTTDGKKDIASVYDPKDGTETAEEPFLGEQCAEDAGGSVTSLSPRAHGTQSPEKILTCKNDEPMKTISLVEGSAVEANEPIEEQLTEITFVVESNEAALVVSGTQGGAGPSQDVSGTPKNLLTMNDNTTSDQPSSSNNEVDAVVETFVPEMQGAVANLLSLEESAKKLLDISNSHNSIDVGRMIQGAAQNLASLGNVEVVQADGTNSLPEENALINAIDSMIHTMQSRAMAEDQPTQAQTQVTEDDCEPHSPAEPSTHVEFIRPLTDSERRKMFNFRTDIDERNRTMLQSGEGAFLCEHCGKVFSLKAIRKHMKTHEKNRERTHICDVCGMGFMENFALKNHLRTHDPNHTYKCRYCTKEYKSKFGRTMHERLHFRVFPETCKKCGEKFSESIRLKRHMEKVHSEPKEPKGKVTWMQRVERQKPPKGAATVTCQICNKELGAMSLRQHLDMHEGKMFTCPTCGKVMKYSTRFAHQRLHRATKDFKCSYCEKEFMTPQSLRNHTRVHTGERPLPCRYCDRTFSRYSSREVHENAHTGLRPYRCTICDKAWKDRSTYRTHMKKNHPNEPLFYKRTTAAINSKQGTSWAVASE